MAPFARLFWGFLFNLIDLRVSGFDILPDLIGYGFMLSGLRPLERHSVRFAKARSFVLPLLFLSVLDLVQPGGEPGDSVSGGVMALILLLGIVSTVIDFLMVFNICCGVAEMARSREFHDLERKAMQRWRLYIGSGIAAVVAIALTLSDPETFIALIILAAVFAIVVAVLMLLLMRESKNRFYPRPFPY
jgi:hypothetical protein